MAELLELDSMMSELASSEVSSHSYSEVGNALKNVQ
jgi:hypothetical protein